MEKTNRFRYAKKRAYPGSSCIYPMEYTWMRQPTPVMTSNITAVSGSTYRVTEVEKSPATIHGKSVAVNASPRHARANNTHAATNEAADAGTAIQCAPRAVSRPKRMLTIAPANGNAGISHTAEVDTGSL